MILQFKEPTKFYYKDSFYWMVTEHELIQFTENFFNEWKSGTELFGCKRRELSVTKPLDDRRGWHVWGLLKKRMKKLEEKETV